MKVLTLARYLFLPAIAAGLALPEDGPVSYDGYKVFRVSTSGGTVESLEDKLANIQYNEWHQDAEHIDIAVAPGQLSAFESLGLEYSIMHEDLGQSIAAEYSTPQPWSRSAVDLSWFNGYHSFEDHKAYFRELQGLLPNNSALISSGTSYQGLDMFGIHLWGSGGPGKPAVLWHGNVHAREWITSMVVEYITYTMVTGYASDSQIKSFLDKYDFYIIPIVNPDGFVYSQRNDRLWRKNRQPPPRGSCVGRDINRQWPYQWNANRQGASTNPCDETYKGEAASDGPENKGLVAMVDKLRDLAGIKLYIDWHSYGQYILWAWGYTCNQTPADSDAHNTLAASTARAIQAVNGKAFTYGPSCATLYPTTGDSVDYLHGPGGSDWSYTIELRDTGNNGFVLPASEILPAGKEAWAGMKVMLSSI